MKRTARARPHRHEDRAHRTFAGRSPAPHQGFALDPPRAKALGTHFLKEWGQGVPDPLRVQGRALALPFAYLRAYGAPPRTRGREVNSGATPRAPASRCRAGRTRPASRSPPRRDRRRRGPRRRSAPVAHTVSTRPPEGDQRARPVSVPAWNTRASGTAAARAQTADLAALHRVARIAARRQHHGDRRRVAPAQVEIAPARRRRRPAGPAAGPIAGAAAAPGIPGRRSGH